MTPGLVRMMGKFSESVTTVKNRLRELGWESINERYHHQTSDWFHKDFPNIILTIGYAGSLTINHEYIWEKPVDAGLLTTTNEEIMEGLMYAQFDNKL